MTPDQEAELGRRMMAFERRLAKAGLRPPTPDDLDKRRVRPLGKQINEMLNFIRRRDSPTLIEIVGGLDMEERPTRVYLNSLIQRGFVVAKVNQDKMVIYEAVNELQTDI